MEMSPDDLRFVSSVVLRTARFLPPQFDREDLIQAGRLAAIQATLAYRPDIRGASWRTFARYRIRGAVLMAARRRNWVEAWHESTYTYIGEPRDFLDRLPGPMEQFNASHIGRVLRGAIDALPNPERWVFQRRQLDGAAPWRIAKQARWPIMRVLAVESAAKQILQRELTAQGITPRTACLA